MVNSKIFPCLPTARWVLAQRTLVSPQRQILSSTIDRKKYLIAHRSDDGSADAQKESWQPQVAQVPPVVPDMEEAARKRAETDRQEREQREEAERKELEEAKRKLKELEEAVEAERKQKQEQNSGGTK